MVDEIIVSHLRGIDPQRYVEVAFYGGSFTAIPAEKQEAFLKTAAAYLKQGNIQAIRVSTRPDCISGAILDRLLFYGVKTIEIGVQSFDNSILANARRGHREEDVCEAVRFIRKSPLSLGIQLMPGLPGDTWQTIMRTTEKTICQAPDFVRIYPTVVLRGTQLEKLYNSGGYRPLTLEAAVHYSMVMKALLEKNKIKVIRTGLQATEQLDGGGTVLAGPYHPAFGELVDAKAFFLRIARFFEQAALWRKRAVIFHHPSDTSKIRGHKNSNVILWRQIYGLREIIFKPELDVMGQIVIEADRQRYILTKIFI